MTTEIELRARQALLQQLRATGAPEALAKADALQRTYHDDEMGGLAADVYVSAMHQGEPPAGWTRASELIREGKTDELYRRMPELANIPKGELLGYLEPKDSGFRAEIYLPDPEVLGPGYKPVAVPKGSAGSVMVNGRLQPTWAEDFLANNFPQSVGLKTEYYDKTMRLAAILKDHGADVEYAGHSLGGGMASAMAAVTGQPATTFNAAGLHPETSRRFMRENYPGTLVYDTTQTVAAYQVTGELLTDGQERVVSLDTYRRAQLATVMKAAHDWMDDTPDGRALMVSGLNKLLPGDQNRDARASVREFVTTLADGNVDRLLKDLPLAAGDPHALPAMREDGSRLVSRKDWMSLSEVSMLAGPVLDVASVAAKGAQIGQAAGQVPAQGGRVAGRALDASGDVIETGTRKAADLSNATTRVVGEGVQTGVRAGGEGIARAREAAGTIEVGVDHAQGAVQDRAARTGASILDRISKIDALPDGLQRRLGDGAEDLREAGQAARTRYAHEAAEAEQRAHREARSIRGGADELAQTVGRVSETGQRVQRGAIGGAGEVADQSLDTAGRIVQGTTARAPTVGATVGATATGAVAVAAHSDLVSALKTSGLAASIVPSGNEAFQRHLKDVFMPSMEAQVDRREREAEQLLQNIQQRHQPEPAPAIDAQQRSADPATPRQREAHDQALREPNRQGNAHEATEQVAQREAIMVPANFAPVRELPKDLRDPDHPGNARYTASLDNVRRMEGQNGITSGPHSERLAAAVAIAVERDQLKVQRLDLDKSTGQVTVIERGPYPNFEERRVPIDTRQALGQSFEQSSQQWLEARSPHYAVDVPKAERSREQSEALAQLTPADQAMFAKIREGIPASVSDDHVAQATLAAKRDGITEASKINQVAMVGDKLWVEGTVPGHRAAVDVSQPAPALQETAQQSQSFNRQREIQLAQEAQQRSQNDPSQGPKMT